MHSFNGFKYILLYFLSFLIFFSFLSTSSYAANYLEEAEERKYLEIQSNNYENWPLGPSIGAEAAILMEANSGSILYAKNIHKKLYPASITKLLTSYIAVNHCEMSEQVLFSEKAVHSINWWEDANMAVNPNTVLSVRDVLSGILVGSANEAAYALAEHISGDLTSFSTLMNKTAKDLGCENSHFVNPNGIHNENHYTTAYDMALIARAFFSDDFLAKLSRTLQYQVPTNSTQKKENIILNAKSQLLPGKPYSYDSLIGTKTGFTDIARQTLVSCAEKNGMKLICVILKEEAPFQFSDTVELFNYGFDNFSPLYLTEINNPYSIENHFFTSSFDVLGNSKTMLTLNNEDYLVLPKTITMEDLTSRVNFDTDPSSVCSIGYYYKSQFLGSIDVIFVKESSNYFDFHNGIISSDQPSLSANDNILLINVSYIILVILLIFILSILYSLFVLISKNKRSKSSTVKISKSLKFARRKKWNRKF